MLGRSKQGAPLIITKPQDLSQQQPFEQGFSVQSMVVEKVHVYDDLSLGYGQRIQQQPHERRYYYTDNADLSVGGVWMKGPALSGVTPVTTDATNGATKFLEMAGVLYALVGRYCLVRGSDLSWTVSKDFGVGKVAFDGIVFFTNVGGGQNLLYVGMGDSELMWKFDGAVWTQHATLFARSFQVVGREFWRSYDVNKVAKVTTDTDPWTAVNWGAAFTIGDRQFPITRLGVTVTSGLLIFKTDGIYSLDSVGVDHNLYPFLRGSIDANNGVPNGSWINDVYVGYRDGLLRIGADYSVRAIGPELLVNNDSPVRGRITGVIGHDTFNLYAAINNEDTGNSYLLKFGSWLTLNAPPDWIAPQGTTAQRLEAWHGSIGPTFTGKRITAMGKSSIGAPASHYRLYLGFSDGTIQWFTLPCAPNPQACSAYTFSAADGFVYLPPWHAMAINDLKAVKAFTVSSLNASPTDYAELEFQTGPAGWVSSNVDYTQAPRQRADAPVGTQGSLINFRVRLKTNGGTTPLLTGLAIHHAVRPQFVPVMQFSILVDTFLVKRDGTRLRQSVDDLRRLVNLAAQLAGPVPVTLPDETQWNLAIVGYEEGDAWDERLKRWSGAIKLTCAPFQTTPVAGPRGGTTYAQMAQYTYAALALNTYGGLLVLAGSQPQNPTIGNAIYGTYARFARLTYAQLALYQYGQLAQL